MAGLTVSVEVSIDDKGNLTCSPDPVKVQGADALLVFEMTSPGWTFAKTNAIALKEPASDFPYASWTIKPTTAVLVDLNRVKGTFPYNVAVVQTSTGKEFVFDPSIENEA
jgi:hypothetical protein